MTVVLPDTEIGKPDEAQKIHYLVSLANHVCFKEGNANFDNRLINMTQVQKSRRNASRIFGGKQI